jgi:hypothetical protein
MRYSSNQLKVLCKTNQKELVRLLTSPGGEANTIATGIEILSEESSDDEIVIPVFRLLLKHVHASVREGAMIGIASFFLEKKAPSDILDKLKLMSKNDPSPNLKQFAQDLLKDLANQ